jgi:hypothetical protein
LRAWKLEEGSFKRRLVIIDKMCSEEGRERREGEVGRNWARWKRKRDWAVRGMYRTGAQMAVERGEEGGEDREDRRRGKADSA